MHKRALVVFLGALSGWACGDSGNPPPSNFPGNDDSSNSNGNSAGGSGGSSGSHSAGGAAGEGPTSSGGTAGSGGNSGGSGGSGTGGSGTGGGSGGDDTSSATSTDGPTMLPEIEACPSDDVESPPEFEATCTLDPAWGEGQPLALGDSSDAQLIAVTPDELTVVWFTPEGSVGQVLVADRASVDDDFGAPIVLPGAIVFSVSADGLRLVTTDEGLALATRSRAARGDEFDAPDEGEFELLNADAEENALYFESAVVSPDDQTLYYSVTGFENDDYPLYVSERSGDEPWPVGERLETCEFRAYGALKRIVTGVSSDGLTVFFDDPAIGGARAAFRETVDSDFEWFVNLGAIGRAQPNEACDRLYFWDSEASTVSVSDLE